MHIVVDEESDSIADYTFDHNQDFVEVQALSVDLIEGDTSDDCRTAFAYEQLPLDPYFLPE